MPGLGGSITAGGNILIDIANGKLPDFKNPGDVLLYGAKTALDGIGTSGVGSLTRGIGSSISSLSKLDGIRWVQSFSYSPTMSMVAPSTYLMGDIVLTASRVPVTAWVSNAGRLFVNQLPNKVQQAAKTNTKILGTSRDNLLNTVENPKLKNIVNDLYRPGAKVGNGSSMDAFRLEQLTGGTVGDKSHTTKLLNYRTALQRLWGNRSNLSDGDRRIIKQLLEDIQNALSGH